MPGSFSRYAAIDFTFIRSIRRTLETMTVTDLIIYPQDFTLFLKIILVPIVFEVIRIIFGKSTFDPLFFDD